MNFTTPYSFEFQPDIHAEYQKNQDSLTVPDMSYTVRELLEKFTTNSIPPIHQQASEGDESYDDAHTIDVDLVDIMVNREKQFELKQQLKTEQTKRENEKRKLKSEELKAQQEELEALRALKTNVDPL